MKTASVWRGSLVLLGGLLIGCGQAPGPASAPDSLLPTQQALSCSNDTEPPEMSIVDMELFYECTGLEIGNVWEPPGALAIDACEGVLPVYRFNSGDDDGDGVPGSEDPDDFGPGPTTETEGTYYVWYGSWDSRGNTRGAGLSVNVRDTLKPLLWLNTDNDGGDPGFEQVECLTPGSAHLPHAPPAYVAPGASALDQCYGNMTSQVASWGEVLQRQPGTYTVTYQVQDRAWHSADPVVRTVVVNDSLAPVLTQYPPIPVWPGTGWMRPVHISECVKAEDVCDGDLDPSQHVTGLTLTSNDPGNDAQDIVIHNNTSFEVRARYNANGTPRVYTARYAVVDRSGNQTPGECRLYLPLNPNDPAP
jgi:large repetitive protein